MIKVEEQCNIREDNNQTLDEYLGDPFIEEILGVPINKEDSASIANILKKYVEVGTRVSIETKIKFKKSKYGLIALYEIIMYDNYRIIGSYALLQRKEGFYIHRLKCTEFQEEGKSFLGFSQDKGKGVSLGNKKEFVSKKLIDILFN